MIIFVTKVHFYCSVTCHVSFTAIKYKSLYIYFFFKKNCSTSSPQLKKVFAITNFSYCNLVCRNESTDNILRTIICQMAFQRVERFYFYSFFKKTIKQNFLKISLFCFFIILTFPCFLCLYRMKFFQINYQNFKV